MFKLTLIIMLALMAAAPARANSTSNDFGRYTGELTPIKPEELRARMQVNGDIYVLDAKGNKVLFRGPESRQWKFSEKGTIESNWSATLGNYPTIALKHTWTIGEDGVVKVKIQQYDSMGRGADDGDGTVNFKYGKLIKEEEKTASDFSPITWTAISNENYRMVVRFIPSIQESQKSQNIADYPITGTNLLISDNQGHTWMEPVKDVPNNKYVAFVTHLGELALSYYEFPGAMITGTAKGSNIELEIEKGVKVRLTSGTPFLPGDMTTKVYAFYNPKKKSSRLSSTHIMTTDKQDRFLAFLNLKAE